MATRKLLDSIKLTKFIYAITNLVPEFRDAVRGNPKLSLENHSMDDEVTEAVFGTIKWETGKDNSTTPPSAAFGPCPHPELVWADIQTEMNRLQAEYDASEYARTRKGEYPRSDVFIEAYTEKEIDGDSTKWDAYVIARNKVRSDNPKP